MEDDWVLNFDVDIKFILRNMILHSIDQAILRAYKYSYDKICLSPSFMRTTMGKYISGFLRTDINPEIQLRGRNIEGLVFKAFPSYVIVKDIGRRWLLNSGCRKPDKKSDFIKWLSR